MDLPLASHLLFALAGFGASAMLVELACLWALKRRPLPVPGHWPSVSILKPLCGLDDELLENLESHLGLDYPGEYEVLLGVRSPGDAAYPLAQAFARRHPGKVRLCLQQGEPGHNPKVNQLVTLTREARHEVLVVTDSNVRVSPGFLREHVAMLSEKGVGLSSHAFFGVGEQKLGSVLDNLTLASFSAPSLAGGFWLSLDQVVGKSLALRKDVLKQMGGWHEFKDVLAEDQRMGLAIRTLNLRTTLGPSPVWNVQKSQPLSAFWKRHARWSMIRFRVLMPAVLFEPLLNPFALAFLGAVLAGAHRQAWLGAGAAAMFSMAYTQAASRIGRGHGFALKHLAWVPVRDLLFLLIWARGATMRWVDWRGNRLQVLAQTRLAAPEALERLSRLSR